jgi:hypothetical protein
LQGLEASIYWLYGRKPHREGMRAIKHYLDAARDKLDPSPASRENKPTDYWLAKQLGARPSLISNYRSGLSFPDEAVAIRLAKLLEIDPLEIIAVANYDRAIRTQKTGRKDTSEEQKFWRQVYRDVARRK